jgi:hypothetical protein
MPKSMLLFYFVMSISEAIILYLPECKTTLRHPPKKTCLPGENVYIQEIKGMLRKNILLLI